MKILGTISLAALFFLMAGSVATYSQDRDQAGPDQAQEQKDKARNNDNQDTQEDKAVKREDKQENKDASKPEKRPEQEQPETRQEEHPDKNATKQEQKQQKQEQKEQRSEQKSDQRMERGDQHQHPAAANQGRHIPDDKFRAHFGRQHTFHVHRTEVINVSQPVVVFGGYSFELVDAWPSDWDFDDDCYIDYVDGDYFLFDTFHPGIRIAVFVVE